MKLALNIREAVSNLFSAKLRTFLAVLGVLVGSGSVVAMVSTGELATRAALAEFKQLGTNLLAINIYESNAGQDENNSSKKTTVENIKILHQTLKKSVPSLTKVAPYIEAFLDVNFRGNTFSSAIVLGTVPSLESIINIELLQGRFLTGLDRNAYYAVIGYDLYQEIKQQGIKNPIGFQIVIGHDIFIIIGVAKPWRENSFFNQNINHSVIIPIAIASTLSNSSEVYDLVVRLKKEANVSEIQKNIIRFMNNFFPNYNIIIRSPQQIVDGMKKQRQTLTLLLALIGSISLIVGGIGVMNIMLVSVVERRKEIGIRMAIGAKRRDIQLLFLVEAIALTLFGGILGIVLGIGISFAIAFFAQWEFFVFWFPSVVGFSVSVLTGIFFGFYPAYQASRLDPIQTLRS